MEKLLILGGTNFIGRVLVQKLLQQGKYDITLFNRGKTNAELYPEIKRIVGDRRTNDIKQIAEVDWDYMIDLSSYFPNPLKEILRYVNPTLKRYVYISTVSVYDIDAHSGTMHNEKTKMQDCLEEEMDDSSNATYGKRKAACEQLITRSGLNHIILRPSVVYGEYDYTDRLYYWLYQVKNHSTILRPQNHHRKFSYTYIQDLVNVIMKSLEVSNSNEAYNVISQPEMTIGYVLNQAAQQLGTKPNYKNASSEFYKANEVKPFVDVPIWIDSDHFTFSNEKMLQDFDVKLSDFDTNLKRTIAYYDSLNWYEPRFGLSGERNHKLVQILSA